MTISMNESYARIFLRFLRFGLLAWGGPVAQIAMIKKELVEEEKWISMEQFHRVLAVYQVLPGPEAHELCVYFGMRAGGRWGGFLAGLGFMLPGFILILFLTWFYVHYGIHSPLAQTLFTGIQAAVVSLIVFAVYRIGKHSVANGKLFAIAILSGISFFLGGNFLIILVLAGVAYMLWDRNKLFAIFCGLALATIILLTVYENGINLRHYQTHHSTSEIRTQGNAGHVFVTGIKAGLLSFGGAYTSIPIVEEDAVTKHHWMTQAQFLDGIALSGILPAPLIIFSTFVGYFGGGWLGAILITIGVFFPAFSFTLIGHAIMERLIANKKLHSFLDGVTAAVVGLIAITAIRLFITTVTGLSALLIFSLGLLVLIKFRSRYTVLVIVLGAGLIKLLWSSSL